MSRALAIALMVLALASCAGPTIEHTYKTDDLTRGHVAGQYEYQLKLASKVEW